MNRIYDPTAALLYGPSGTLAMTPTTNSTFLDFWQTSNGYGLVDSPFPSVAELECEFTITALI